MDADLNSDDSSAPGENGGQSKVGESSVARTQGSEAATASPAGAAASDEASLATGVGNEGQTKAVIVEPVEPSVGADKTSSAGETGRDSQVGGSSVGIVSPDAAAANPLGHALAALDRKDYATAKRLFEALGRKDAAAAIESALAAFERKDYATAEGLFEALSPPKPAPAQQKPVTSPLVGVPFVDEANRRPLPQSEKTKARGLKPLLLGTGLALFAIFGASAIYISPLTFAAVKTQAIAGLASAADLVKAPLEAVTGQESGKRSAPRCATSARRSPN